MIDNIDEVETHRAILLESALRIIGGHLIRADGDWTASHVQIVGQIILELLTDPDQYIGYLKRELVEAGTA